MRPLAVLAAALSLSVLLYVAVFSVVHRPLTVGDIPRMLEHKLAYAATLPSPRLVIFAGSNGRYSHRCEPMAAPLGLPCVNMSIAVGIGLDFMLDQLHRMLRPGDIVYMPLEYSEYLVDRAEMEAGIKNPVLVHDLREQLWALPLPAIARAHASFDLPFLMHGLAEMGLSSAGLRRRSGLDALTPQGDESGHTAEQARPYRDFLARTKLGNLDIVPLPQARTVLTRFLLLQHERGVLVVGGLPTATKLQRLPQVTVDRLRQLYEAGGQEFLVLDSRSQYELTCFFDTVSHLNEACQIEHSRAVGKALAERPSRGR